MDTLTRMQINSLVIQQPGWMVLVVRYFASVSKGRSRGGNGIKILVTRSGG